MHIRSPQPPSIVPCSNWHLDYVCNRMPTGEVEQYLAIAPQDVFEPDAVARELMTSGGVHMAVLGEDETPLAACGYAEVSRGVWQFWVVCTSDGWLKQRATVEKSVCWALDSLFEIGARRIQTNVLASRDDSLRWHKEVLGMKCEGIWARFGKSGEDIACLARIRKEH